MILNYFTFIYTDTFGYHNIKLFILISKVILTWKKMAKRRGRAFRMVRPPSFEKRWYEVKDQVSETREMRTENTCFDSCVSLPRGASDSMDPSVASFTCHTHTQLIF